MKIFWSNRLQIRTTCALLAMAAGLAIIFASLIYPIERARTADQVTRVRILLETIYKQKRDDFANAFFNYQHDAIRQNLQEINGIVGEIVNVCFYEKNDAVRFCAENSTDVPERQLPFAQNVDGDNFAVYQQNSTTYASYINVVEIIGEPVGYLGIYYDIEQIMHGKARLLTTVTLLFCFGVLVIILLFNLFLERSIITPLNLLRKGMHRVSEGDLGETVVVSRTDEIGDMVSTFNVMSRKLFKNSRELRQYHLHLEELVRERTAALTIAKNEAEAAGEKQREQWKLLKTVMETIPSPIFYKDLQGRYLGCNPAFEEFVGASRREILGRTVHNFMPPKVAQRFMEKDRELIANPGKQSYTWYIVRPDGVRRDVSYHKATITDDSGQVIGIVGIMTDLTEMIEARRQAEQANQAKSRFLANMSHEIRTPMNGVIGMTNLLLETELDQLQRDYLETIRASGNSLLSVINDILDYSKIEAGKLMLQFGQFDLRQLLDECLAILSPRAREKSLALVCRVDPDVPAQVISDSGRLRQIVLNLAGNAVKFTEQGSVRVSVVKEEENEQGVLLRFAVADTGIGIAQKDQEALFDSFFQVDGSSTRRFGGTGLGLTISRQLVELLGGTIRLESVKGQGATFTFRVRMKRGVEEVGVVDGEAKPPSAEDYQRRILVVEDNRINLKVVLGVLKNLGYDRIDTAANGRRALELLADKVYDLVLMDLSMPEIDGLATTRALRESQETIKNRDVPVIALTAHAMRGDRKRCFDAGMNGYLSKPLNPLELNLLLAELWQLDIAGQSEPVADSNGEQSSGTAILHLDFPGLVERLQGDRSMAEMIVQELARELPVELRTLQNLVEAGKCHESSRQAHKLKGMSSNVGAMGLQRIFAEMEIAGRDNRGELLAELMVSAIAAGEELMAELDDVGFV